jgi:Phage tail sheath C-terminal domain
MALVSPGQQITVTDESQYISNAVGTVPLVVLATAQDKTINGHVATGTTKVNAGKLQIFGSQRDLTTAMGTPTFQRSTAGTPLHGDERNEYGLMAAYSALGVTNQIYAVRADLDLDQLQSTSVRPTSPVASGTNWLDLADTTWGIYEWSAETQSFTAQTPIVVTSSADTYTASGSGVIAGLSVPNNNIGTGGAYAVVTTSTNNRIFHKAGPQIGIIDPNSIRNTWQLVGGQRFHSAHPAVTGTVTNPTGITGNLTINGTAINTVTGANAYTVATTINNAMPSGNVTADVLNGKLALYGDGTSAVTISTSYSGAANLALLNSVGLSTGVYDVVEVAYGDFAHAPAWTAYSGDTARPSGGVWFKTGAIGGGANFVIKKYNAVTDAWTTQAAQVYDTQFAALLALDPIGGGKNIAVGTVYVRDNPGFWDVTYGGYNPRVRAVAGAVTGTGTVATSANTFVNGSSLSIQVSQPGLTEGATTTYSATLSGTSGSAFITALLTLNIPNFNASIDASGYISLTHTAGGDIKMYPGVGSSDILTRAGFTAAATNTFVYTTNARTYTIVSGFQDLTYTYSNNQPVADPMDGTLWYYGDATVADIMINTGTAWKGYQNVTSDLRGYNLANTDPAGIIVAASTPMMQTDNTALVAGDLWLDTGDLENWPAISRYNGTNWILLDNTDQVSSAGILFADARWDKTGTTDPAAGDEVSIKALLTSDYLDLDAPNPLLYPRGMLLFNTRRSGYNVKRYVDNYYTTSAFDIPAWSASTTYVVGAKVLSGATVYVAILGGANHAPSSSPTYWTALTTSSWVTASGLKANGSPYAGHAAQREVIVSAMKSALDSNTEIREDQFKFNLICTPGYPELIPNMVSLNNDRANTAFVIGDTPMDLSTNSVGIINWSNNTNGDGLAIADPYMAVYYPSGLSSDLGGNTIMVPASHMALRTYLYNDNVAYQWFAPAGTRRGLVSNATDLGYLNRATGEFNRTGVNQALRDTLYQNKMNPITIIPGIGLVVWGQKTRDPNTESMDRVNVSRLVNYIRTIFASAGNAFLFEPNDKITRDQFGAILRRALNDLVAKRGIYDYLVVCDTTNNTPDRIANNQLYADIAIEPMKDVEFIYIPIRLYNPGDIAKLGGK